MQSIRGFVRHGGIEQAAPAAYSGAAPETAGQILARLNKLPAEQRQKQLSREGQSRGRSRFL